ncbi:MAG: hypothetical protein HZC14_02380 [Candidatus Niyogibacteria bacterium]|nr:hypothetical protein [Candidatus Niyogibacteria bacterium]
MKKKAELKADLSEDSKHAQCNVLKKRKWDEPHIFQIKKADWDKPGTRVGCISGIAYSSQGFRAGLVEGAFELFRNKAAHFNVLNGHIVDEKALKVIMKEKTAGLKGEEKQMMIDHILEEAAKALAALIPKIEKPHDKGEAAELVRLYIMTSPKLDGKLGDAVMRRLQDLRPDDIRLYNSGGDKLEVKGKVEQVLWFLNPKKSRLPSKIYSTACEKEIDDKRRQTTQQMPHLWVVGGFASAVHIPSGIRHEPYCSLPALRRLEEVEAAENQVGAVIIDISSAGEFSFESWSYKDLVAKEREFITGISTGADEAHKKIVAAIKNYGPLTLGMLVDKTGLKRGTIEKAMKLLVTDEMSDRTTWPGLHYNQASQRYDFHLPWIQEMIKYPCIDCVPLVEDRILFFGCMHAGYTTTDYQFLVEYFPEIMLKHDVRVLCGLGDFIAGLHHDFMCSGETFGQLNNTEQEQLAADILATIMFRVFEKRFAEKIGKNATKISREELERVVGECLILFVYICGNHDLWQEKDGSTPLAIFRYRLIQNLTHHISKSLIDMRLPAISLHKILESKINSFPDYKASYVLPSGLRLGMMHPHMGRGQTTSKAQVAMGLDGCQITGIANFHAAAVVREWWPGLGQQVVVQAGTEVLYTRFERRKMKSGVDFGPIFLRVLSHGQRIVATESAYFNEPLLKEAIKKSTDPDDLRKRLGILAI